MFLYFSRTLNTIFTSSFHHYVFDYFISTNQNNKDELKKATVEMKLKERQSLVGRCNTCLSFRGGTTIQGVVGECGDSKSLLKN